jgi:hypothetical protein
MDRARRQPPSEPEPGSGVGSGSVGEGGAPGGYYWDRLAEGRGNAKALDKLEDELIAHRYSADGQLRQAVEAARDEASGRRPRSKKED